MGVGKGLRIGVLAFQGDFCKHVDVLRLLGADVQEVRKASELIDCDGLIIPGGESTVILRQLDRSEMREPLIKFAKQKHIFGTCAGLIAMSCEVHDFTLRPLNLLDVSISRNAYGRQIDSFQTSVTLELNPGKKKKFTAFFIRAPRIRKCGKDVEILGTLDDEPILVRQGLYLGATFHPELTADPLIHHYFLEMIRSSHHPILLSRLAVDLRP